jgi:hypothetical protein
LSLETFEKPGDLYLARGEEVNPLRPLFTGDVVADVAIPGVQDGGMAVVVAHPCSMRGKDAQLEPSVLVAAVAESGKIGREAWAGGHFGFMPLPDLVEAGKLWVARLDDIGKALTEQLVAGVRVACLKPFGVNLLQQRFIWRLTRHEVPTYQLQEVSAHVFEEADLLEEWSDTVCAAGSSPEQAAAAFEAFVRADRGDGNTLQSDLRDPQRRSTVRSACRVEAQRVAEELGSRA